MTTPQAELARQTRPEGSPSLWYDFLCFALMFIALLAVFTKYLFPVGFSLAYELPLLMNIDWDLWPLVHFWLGWIMLQHKPYALSAALLITVVEILYSTSKLAMFLADPVWDMWNAGWFVNEMFIAMTFITLWFSAWRFPGIFPYAFMPLPTRLNARGQTEAPHHHTADH